MLFVNSKADDLLQSQIALFTAAAGPLDKEAEIIVAGLLQAAGGLSAFASLTSYGVAEAYDSILWRIQTIVEAESCEKTVFGTRLQRIFCELLGLPTKTGSGEEKNPHHLILDTEVSGTAVDIKATIGGDEWTIPKECVDHWLILFRVCPYKGLFSVGVFHALSERLRTGENNDGKVGILSEYRHLIRWIVLDAPFRLKKHGELAYPDKHFMLARSAREEKRFLAAERDARLLTEKVIDKIGKAQIALDKARADLAHAKLNLSGRTKPSTVAKRSEEVDARVAALADLNTALTLIVWPTRAQPIVIPERLSERLYDLGHAFDVATYPVKQGVAA